jgi:hypothetical protein
MDSIKVGNANKRKKCQQDGIKNDFFSGLVIFNNYRMFTFLISNSDVDYRLVEKYFPNCCWTTPIGKLARATRDRIVLPTYGNTLVPFFGHHKFKKFSNIFCKVKTKSKNLC